MIIEQNVPTPVRTWAYCQDMTRHYEKLISILKAGSYFSMGTRGIYVCFMKRYGSTGKRKYLEEYCKPESERLKRRCDRYRALADRIRQESEISPENWLLSKEEALNLIGSTLHYKVHGKDVYDTLLRCSEDGEKIFSSIYNSSGGTVVSATSAVNIGGTRLDALTLLSLGFGKNQQ